MTAYLQSQLGFGTGWFVANTILILLIALPLMLAVAMLIYADRKIWAAMALRKGPNVVGPFGLLQSFADGLKVFLQETILPSSADKGLFLLAPIITFTVALIVWAVVPFGPGMVLSDINVGLLYILAASSLGVYGVMMAGWASNSKYPFYSALRAAAQMVSYEVSIGFVIICVVLYAGTFNLTGIVMAQQGNVLGLLNGFGFNPLLFPMAVVFLISSMAETFRTPFDLVEAESELVAGHQTEYSSMSFALFWLGEYANVILMCALNAILFWGGFLPPLNIDLIPWFDIPGILWLLLKMSIFFFIFGWVKATVPRYRYDQLMRLGWKIFLPLSLLFVVLISGWLMLTRYGPQERGEVAAYGAPVGRVVRTTFACALKSKGEQRTLQLVIDERRVAGTDEPRQWSVTVDGDTTSAKEIVYRSDSIGGSTGLSWKAADQRETNAQIDWSDNIGPKGPEGWIRIAGEPGTNWVGNCAPTVMNVGQGNLS